MTQQIHALIPLQVGVLVRIRILYQVLVEAVGDSLMILYVLYLVWCYRCRLLVQHYSIYQYI